MKNIKKTSLICAGISLMTALVMMSCGQPQTEPEETLPVPTEEPAATVQPNEPFTEEELRQAISELREDEASLAQKLEYYERLLSMDVFAEEDYEELARIYGGIRDWQGQRRILFKLLRLYPSAEHAEQLSAVTVYRDDTEEDMVSLAGQIKEALESQDALTLWNLTLSEEWCRLLQEDLEAIETRTRYQAGEEILQVVAGGPAVEITWRDGQGCFLFYQGDETGAVVGSATLADGAYTGDVKATYSDGEGNVTKSLQGTLENGVCVGMLTVVYQGVEYSGTFREDGTTAEEQIKEVTDQGGVLYAYGPGGRTYLYQENVEIADFRIGPAFFGLPEYVEWR
ncbi:MAG: hypothetical protein K2K19_05015 [Acetatifactor sp.]|nr:hypothetical protein [Acetatifactor sp.]